MRYVKKPVVIEAFKYDGDFIKKNGRRYVPMWAIDALEKGVMEFEGPELYVNTLEGRAHVSVGDYIIRGVNGELYPCDPDIFEKTYGKVSELPCTHE